MSVRSLEELAEIVQEVSSRSDVTELEMYLDELQHHGTTKPLAIAVHTLGMHFHHTGDNEKALRYNRWAVGLHTELGDHLNAANAMCNIGYNLSNMGDYPGALEQFSRAMHLQEAHAHRVGVAISLLGLAAVFASTGDYPESLARNMQALDLFEDLGDRRGMAMALNNIASIYTTTGSFDKGLEYHNKALTINEEEGSYDDIVMVTGNIGVTYWKSGNYEQARQYFEKALRLRHDSDHYRDAAFTIGNLVTVCIDLHDWEQAEAYLARLDTLHVSNVDVITQRERSRSAIQIHNGDLASAHATLQKALQISIEHANMPEIANVHKQLRDLALLNNDLPGYVEHNNEYTRVSEEINGKDTATRLAMQGAQRQMELERKQHEKHLAILYATLPKTIADRVARGETVSDHFNNAAVLFIDIVGFTTHSANLSSTKVTALLEDIFRTFDAICKEYGVIKVKTIGDAYLCFAHAVSEPEQQTHSPEHRIAAAALAMLEATFYWPSDTTDGSHEDLRFRMGIHAGAVTAGVIGTERLQYDIWGDTVNTASRMESSGVPGRLNVSIDVAKALEGAPDFALHPRGVIDVKGKGPMELFFVTTNEGPSSGL